MTTQVVRFKMEHLDQIHLRERESSGIAKIPHYRKLCEVYEKYGGTYTLLSPEGVVCIEGVAPIWPGVAGAWSLTSDLIFKYPKAYYKATKQFMAAIVTDWKIHRLQATTCADDAVACNWLRHLGFKQEGVLKSYGPDRADHIMFSKVSQWTQ